MAKAASVMVILALYARSGHCETFNVQRAPANSGFGASMPSSWNGVPCTGFATSSLADRPLQDPSRGGLRRACATLFDHLVGAGEQGRRNCNLHRTRRAKIDGKLDVGRLLERKL